MRTPNGSGKYIAFRLRIETGAERTTAVDILDIIQQVRDTGIHLKQVLDFDQMCKNTVYRATTAGYSTVRYSCKNSINSASVQLHSRNMSTNTVKTTSTKQLRAPLGSGTKRSTSL